MFNKALDFDENAIPFIMEGQVMASHDPDQMGRLKVWVPSLDGENINIDFLPWTEYASPFMGYTVEYPAGGIPVDNTAHAAYGFWAIPKIGATVLVFCLNANPNHRFYFASTARMHRNRSLPAGRNTDFFGKQGPWGDAGDGTGNLNPIQPAYDNIRTQFQNKIEESEALTRGAVERQVAQAKLDKDGTEGYSPNADDPSYLDSQTLCITTPGRHVILMQDHPKQSRMRFKTAEGHQIIFDDANERIYVSTAKGKSWFEMDQDGHVNVFGAESISIRAGANINMFADKDINIEANGAVNVKANTGDIRMNTTKSFQVNAKENILMSACGIFDVNSEKSIKLTSALDTDILAGGSVAITAGDSMHLKAGAQLIEWADAIHLNGPVAKTAVAASCAALAESPTIVPGHEPWPRPASKVERGPNWRA